MPVWWWVAGAAVVVGTAVLALGEPVLVARTAGDTRPVHIQQRNRRALRWLVALATVAVAQISAVAVAVAGVDWAGSASMASVIVVVTAAALAAAAFGVTVRHPARGTDVPIPTSRAVLAPALITAAAQEVIFRGCLLGLVSALAWPTSAAGVTAAVVISSVVFGVTRLPRGPHAAVAATLIGAALGTVTALTGWVAVAVTLHVALLLVVAAAGSRGVRVPAAAAGGAAGVGCGSHDPNSPSCAGCPLAAAAPRASGRTSGRSPAPA